MIDLFLAWANHDPRWHSTEFGEKFHADGILLMKPYEIGSGTDPFLPVRREALPLTTMRCGIRMLRSDKFFWEESCKSFVHVKE